VLRFGPKFYLQEDSDSVDDVEEDEGEEEVASIASEGERDIVKERWLIQEPSVKLPREESFSEHRKEEVSFQLQPSFPESLTSEDYNPRSSVHTLGSLSRSMVDSAVTSSERRRRRQHSAYEPPTFHS
jgi:hypothetical protein